MRTVLYCCISIIQELWCYCNSRCLQPNASTRFPRMVRTVWTVCGCTLRFVSLKQQRAETHGVTRSHASAECTARGNPAITRSFSSHYQALQQHYSFCCCLTTEHRPSSPTALSSPPARPRYQHYSFYSICSICSIYYSISGLRRGETGSCLLRNTLHYPCLPSVTFKAAGRAERRYTKQSIGRGKRFIAHSSIFFFSPETPPAAGGS